MVPTIPPEIWLMIAEFIPSDILRNLYSVNPVFLHLALNELYNEVNFAVRCTSQTAKYFKHLNHPHIARRVQRLILPTNCTESNMINILDLSEKITLWTGLAWYLPFHLGWLIDPVLRGASNVNTLMEKTVFNFPNLSSLIITDGYSSRIQPDRLLVSAYTACASKLRTLRLTPKNNINVLFPQNASDLTSLEEVTLDFHPLHDCGVDIEAASAFFQAIASTLTTLDISFGVETSYEPLQLLQSFSRQGGFITFPKLTSFSLSQSVPTALLSSNLMQFLDQHADTLKHLHLKYAMPTPIPSKSPLLLVLPHLESLNIIKESPCRFHEELESWEGLDAARAYVQHSRSTLTSLGLTHCAFTLHDLGMLLDLFGPESSENMERGGLKSLTVTVQVLNPQLLDMLAEKVPQLERLIIDFAHMNAPNWGCRPYSRYWEDFPQESIESFLLEMQKRSYSKWALRSLGIKSVSLRSDTAMAILIPLTLCIPNLMEIDGAYMEMWRESGSSTWMASEWTRRTLEECYNLSIGPTGLSPKKVDTS